MTTTPPAPPFTAQFAAIDLDAVLDDFESQQRQQEEERESRPDRPPKPTTPNNDAPSAPVDEPDSIQPEMEPETETPPVLSAKFQRAREPARVTESNSPLDTPPSPPLYDPPPEEDEILQAQPEEAEEPLASTENGDLTSGSSSPSFHSIYDRSVSPLGAALASEPPILDTDRTDASPQPGDVAEMGGTRPKTVSPVITAPSTPPLVPVLVSIPAESPPPYSEVDPINGSQVLRPMRPQDLPIVNAHMPDEGLDEGFDEEPQLEIQPPGVAAAAQFPPPVEEEPPEPDDYLEPMIPSRNPPSANNLEVQPRGKKDLFARFLSTTPRHNRTIV